MPGRSIEKLYRLYLKYYKNENWEKCDKVEEMMNEHPGYQDYHPHNNELDKIPDKVVVDYFFYLIKCDRMKWNWTLDMVKYGMLNYVKALPVLDMDVRRIIDDGWLFHTLEDSNPRCGVLELIEEKCEECLN